jgi:DNA-directed RNA polymerase omega subunit
MAENLDGNTDTTEIENAEGQEETTENPEIDSKYRLILIAAQRSKQLQKGAQPRVDADPRKTKPTRIALEEVKKNKVDFKLTNNK